MEVAMMPASKAHCDIPIYLGQQLHSVKKSRSPQRRQMGNFQIEKEQSKRTDVTSTLSQYFAGCLAFAGSFTPGWSRLEFLRIILRQNPVSQLSHILVENPVPNPAASSSLSSWSKHQILETSDEYRRCRVFCLFFLSFFLHRHFIVILYC
ncbi:hypothetical protein MKZ38_006573 [Zalerion maritima]|uniref:Uncharacterized protein n=1 Tax=Zalerion maritima TaxID=339359 RepID=A0AAD5WQA4_9PEZI|nr:hypothetical protein MKZ38_006573 [Zalerion maritima]